MRHVEIWVSGLWIIDERQHKYEGVFKKSVFNKILCRHDPDSDIDLNKVPDIPFDYTLHFWRIDGVDCFRCLAILREEFGHSWEGRDYP